jgi:hypothetical protein
MRASPKLKRSARSAIQVHLLGGDVARRGAGLLQRQDHRRVAGLAMRAHIALHPVGEGLVVAASRASNSGIVRGQGLVVGGRGLKWAATRA